MAGVVIGTAGHIDHGKSALVRALTGIDPDRLKEEQARGITIDLGFAHATIGPVQCAFVDVPGHERFVRNMLAGAGGIDAVLLVVAANESVMPQTREHFEICRLLGIRQGVIALTKSDLINADELAATALDVRALVAGSFLHDAPIISVSARTGAGLDELRGALVALAGNRSRLYRPGLARLPVDRVFTVKGFGTVATGTLVSGALAVGDEVAVLPAAGVARVRGLHVHGESVTDVAAPQRVAVNLAGIEAAALHRGVTLAASASLAVTRSADVRIRLLKSARALSHGARMRVHQGTADGFARVAMAAVRATPAGEWIPAQPGDALVTLHPGGEAMARLRFDRALVLTRGDRLVLRAGSPVGTIGGAIVLDPEPAPGGIRRAEAFARFRELDGDDLGAASRMLRDAGSWGIRAADLVRRGGLAPSQARDALGARVEGGDAAAIGDRVFERSAVAALRARLVDDVARYHRDSPQDPGIPRETLRATAARRAATALVEWVIEDLAAAGVTRGGERVALASHQPARSSEVTRVVALVEGTLRASALTPPEPAVLSAQLGVPVGSIAEATQTLVREGRVVRIGGMAFHRDALAALKVAVAGLRTGQTPSVRVTLDVAAFKATHGLTRKHAIPLLEWLDRERVTRRVGDVRIVL